jgi:hypothetical protein
MQESERSVIFRAPVRNCGEGRVIADGEILKPSVSAETNGSSANTIHWHGYLQEIGE